MANDLRLFFDPAGSPDDGAALAAHRHGLGLTIEAVADALLLSTSQVRGIEGGSRTSFYNEGFYQRAQARYCAWLERRIAVQAAVEPVQAQDPDASHAPAPGEAVWEQWFAALTAYTVREGHCTVPAQYPANPQLAMWVSKQRASKQRGTLSPERTQRLEALGLVWDPCE